MHVYRLTKKKYGTTLSGKGAAIFGERWNSKGNEVIYTAENRSLAMAEVAVHLMIGMLPSNYEMLTIFIPDTIKIKKVDVQKLPQDWNTFPHPKTTQKIGDFFLQENKFCVLKVPSVVTKGDFNIMINPNHIDFKKIKVTVSEPFPFDRRLFKP